MAATTHELRVLRISGLPVECTGRGLKPAILRWVAGASPNLAAPAVRVFYSFNVHRHVRHGCCFIEFSDHGSAAAALQSVAMEPPAFDGHSLTVEWAAGKLRDHFFATLPFAARREMKLDSHAAFSVTDGTTAARMAGAIVATLRPCLPATSSNRLRIFDAMACVGGNSIAFATHAHVSSVVACEVDVGRATMLRHNLEVACASLPTNSSTAHRTVSTDCFRVLADIRARQKLGEAETDSSFECVFFDPPWGGVHYKRDSDVDDEHAEHGADPHPQPHPTEHAPAAPSGEKESELSPTLACPRGSTFALDNTSIRRGDWCAMNGQDITEDTARIPSEAHDDEVNRTRADESLTLDWSSIAQCILGSAAGPIPTMTTLHPVARSVAFKFGTDARSDAWLQRMISALVHARTTPHEERERVFPFLFHFGASMRLLVVLGNTAGSHMTHEDDDEAKFVMRNARLNTVVDGIVEWHQTDGHREHRPCYYDFDKRRWIQLKKWIAHPTKSV